MLNILGLKDEKQIIGKKDYELIWHKASDKLRYGDQQAMSKQKSLYSLDEVIVSDTTIMNILSFKAPLLDDDQKMIGIVGISLDLQKANILDFNSQVLEDLILKTKITELRKLNHDIKGPLSSVVGMLEILQTLLATSPQIQSAADIVSQAAISLTEFIETLTTECTKDKKAQNPSIINIKDLLNDVYNIARPMAYAKDLVLEYIPDNNESNISSMNKDKLFKILMELTNNALKHTKEGKVTLGYKNIFDKNFIELEISDTGQGIPEDQIQRLLNPLNILDENALINGSGFGLSFVGSMIKTLGIDVEVHNKMYNQGSTVLLKIGKSCT